MNDTKIPEEERQKLLATFRKGAILHGCKTEEEIEEWGRAAFNRIACGIVEEGKAKIAGYTDNGQPIFQVLA